MSISLAATTTAGAARLVLNKSLRVKSFMSISGGRIGRPRNHIAAGHASL
jgi:hypothetical protein